MPSGAWLGCWGSLLGSSDSVLLAGAPAPLNNNGRSRLCQPFNEQLKQKTVFFREKSETVPHSKAPRWSTAHPRVATTGIEAGEALKH